MQISIATLLVVAGSLFYLSSRGERKTLDVPLLAVHTKIIIGGILLLGGFAVLASLFVHR